MDNGSIVPTGADFGMRSVHIECTVALFIMDSDEVSTTENIYSHLDAVTKADTGEAMNKALG